MRPDSQDLARAVQVLENARGPIILVGPRAKGVMHLMSELAGRLGAPVFTTPDAKSLFDESSPYSGGVYSFGATARAQAIVKASDAVLAVGTNLGEFSGGAGAAFDHADVLHVTGDLDDLPIGVQAAVTLTGDVDVTVRALVDRLRRSDGSSANSSENPKPWFESIRARPERARSAGDAPCHGIDAVEGIRALGDALPPQARLACDVTSAALHLLHELALSPDQRLWIQIERSACMGSALAAGLGVRMASGLPTLVVIGDWGFMMNHSELHTAASLEIDGFVVVAWSNCGGALIRSGVRAQGIDVPDDTHTWAPPRFDRVARGYGVRALAVRSARGLRRAAASAMRAPFPVLIDARIDPDGAIPGAGARYLHLESSKRQP